VGGFDTVGLIMVRQILFDVAIAESITQIPAGSDQYNVCLEVAALEWILHVVTSLIEDDVKEIIRSKNFCNTAGFPGKSVMRPKSRGIRCFLIPREKSLFIVSRTSIHLSH